MYIYNTILCIKCSVYGRDGKFDIVLSPIFFFLFLKVVKTLSWCFSFAIWANGNAKIYICSTLPFTALEVYPTMTTSAAEKPGNVKKVYYFDLCVRFVVCFVFSCFVKLVQIHSTNLCSDQQDKHTNEMLVWQRKNTVQMLKTVMLLHICVENVTFIFKDYLMNRKFKRTELIWNMNLL